MPHTTSSIPPRIDHLMVVVPDLEAGVQQFAELTGVAPVKGGRHVSMGTANYLVGVDPLPGVDGPPPYLEILGPDPENAPDASYERRQDLIGDIDGPVLRTWLVRAIDIEADAAAANAAGFPAGEVSPLSRATPDGKLLEWRITNLRPRAFSGAQPGLIDWGDAPHPALSLEPQLAIESVTVLAVDPPRSQAMLQALGLDVTVRAADADGLAAQLKTPNGVITITSSGVL